jgi:hypothetical protein
MGLREGLVFFLVVRWAHRRARREDPEAPGSVTTDELATRLFRQAMRAARAGKDDETAVAELRSLAGRHRRSLRRAEKLSRLGGRHLDFTVVARAHRLLGAAVTGHPLAPIDPAHAQHTALLDGVFDRARGDDAIWADLIARAPQLAALESEVRAGRFGHADEAIGELGEAERQRLATNTRLWFALDARIKTLVGPSSASSDPVIRSRRARAFAAFRLDRLRPDPPPTA